MNNYLETCKELGENPEKEFKGVFSVRVNEKAHTLAGIIAISENFFE